LTLLFICYKIKLSSEIIDKLGLFAIINHNSKWLKFILINAKFWLKNNKDILADSFGLPR